MLLVAAHAFAQTMTPADLIKADYAALTGRWQLVSGTVDGKPVPEAIARATVLITDHDIFRFPADAGVGTAPQGRFTINPTTKPADPWRCITPPTPLSLRAGRHPF